MIESIHEVVGAVDALSALDTAGDLSRLQTLADRYFTHPEAAAHLGVWFRLYERDLEEEGWDVFWSILHGLEAQPGFERFVVESVLRNPARFPVLMVNRLINGGIAQVAGVNLLELLGQAAADERCRPIVRADAERFLAHQRN